MFCLLLKSLQPMDSLYSGVHRWKWKIAELQHGPRMKYDWHIKRILGCFKGESSSAEDPCQNGLVKQVHHQPEEVYSLMRPSTSVIPKTWKQWGRIEVLETLQIDASWREATYPAAGVPQRRPTMMDPARRSCVLLYLCLMARPVYDVWLSDSMQITMCCRLLLGTQEWRDVYQNH